MRRVLAIALLVAFFAPAAAPSLAALTADPEANLPVCCRSHGAHHCAMRHWMLARMDSSVPGFAAAPCPLYPTAAVIPQIAAFAPAAGPQDCTRLIGSAAVVPRAARSVCARDVRGQWTRGPPDVL